MDVDVLSREVAALKKAVADLRSGSIGGDDIAALCREAIEACRAVAQGVADLAVRVEALESRGGAAGSGDAAPPQV